MGVTLWLLPSSKELAALKRLMSLRPSQSKSPNSYPRFDPHITLASVPSSTDPSVLVNAIPKCQSCVPVRFDSIQTGDTFVRSVFVSIKPSAELAALHEVIYRSLGIEPRTPMFPHMSLYYIDDSEPETRISVLKELKRSGIVESADDDSTVLNCPADLSLQRQDQSVSQFNGFDGQQIWVVRCEGPVENWEALHTISLPRNSA